ncbi:heavy-metal-associated domain-containing protein [Thermaurantiacus sp.]
MPAPCFPFLLARPALLAVLLACAPAWAQRAGAPPKGAAAPEAVGDASGLIVTGIEVDETARSDLAAREAGWRQAQRLAWPMLWARLSGFPANRAPRVGDSALDQMVSAIEVEREAVGGNRYVARLTVIFDRTRAAPYLGRYAPLVQSPPLLLLPLLQDAGTRMAYEPGNPWAEAWARFQAGESPIDYIRLRASATDALLLSAWQGERIDIPIWRQIMDRYQTADVLIPELILERGLPGSPAVARLILRFGPSARILARTQLTQEDGDIAALLASAVRECDRLYTTALRAGLLVPDALLSEAPEPEVEVPELAPEIGGRAVEANLRLEVDTPDAASLEAIERRLRAVPGVTGVRLESFVIAGRSVLVLGTSVSSSELARALDAAGFRLEGSLLRDRRADEVPPAPPSGPPAELPSAPPAAPPVPPSAPPPGVPEPGAGG